MRAWSMARLQRTGTSIVSFLRHLVATAEPHVLSRRALQPANTNALTFSKQFRSLAKARGLTKRDALDVYHHGTPVSEYQVAREYNGYTLGIYYFVRPETGQTVITSIWKRDRH